jgi:hypothetical protein
MKELLSAAFPIARQARLREVIPPNPATWMPREAERAQKINFSAN